MLVDSMNSMPVPYLSVFFLGRKIGAWNRKLVQFLPRVEVIYYKNMKTPPSDVEKPTYAQIFKALIDYVIPESSLGLIKIIVIDVSILEGK